MGSSPSRSPFRRRQGRHQRRGGRARARRGGLVWRLFCGSAVCTWVSCCGCVSLASFLVGAPAADSSAVPTTNHDASDARASTSTFATPGCTNTERSSDSPLRARARRPRPRCRHRRRRLPLNQSARPQSCAGGSGGGGSGGVTMRQFWQVGESLSHCSPASTIPFPHSAGGGGQSLSVSA